MIRGVDLFKNAGKVYLLVHLFLCLIRLKNKKRDKWQVIIHSLKNWIKSCLFATGFAISIPFNLCYHSKLIKYATPNYGFLISFLFSWFILFESKSRWAEMSIYVLSQWFEGYTYSLKKRNIIRHNFSSLNQLIFAISFGIIADCFYSVNIFFIFRKEKLLKNLNLFLD